MIGFLKGKVLDQEEGRVTLGVGSTDDSAVGYTVTVGQDHFAVGAPIELHIHTHVREDALDLYGFRTRAEKQLFLALLSVSGIGPKGAMAVMAGGTLDALLDAIENGDVAYLCRAPGVGKKTGERIVLELSDSIRKKRALGLYGVPASASTRGSGATAASGGIANRRTVVFREAMTALVGLGYRSVEVEELLTRIFEESGTEQPARVEDLLKTALRQLA